MTQAQVRRFGVDAPQEERAEFARDLIASLDAVGVRPGQTFLVTTEAHQDAELKAAEAKNEELQNQMNALEEKDAEAYHFAERYHGLVAALEDVPRGIRDLTEVLRDEGIE